MNQSRRHLIAGAVGSAFARPPEIHADCSPVLAFGPFRLFPEQKALYRDGKALRLGSRAKEVLFALVEKAGETVKKRALIARVWPDTIVEDATLRVHIFALRKVLGRQAPGMQYVETINGHGYRLNARVQCVDSPVAAEPPERPAALRLSSS
jgi:DNA-binding winged helix-turn-helix (wHTH) protein